MSTTLQAGETTIHRLVELETGDRHALEFLPDLTPELLDANRAWLRPAALDERD